MEIVQKFLSRCQTFMAPISRQYRRLFSIQEIEDTPLLQWMLGASLFFFFLTFNRWLTSGNLTIEQVERGQAVCWEYFQSCTDWYFLHQLGTGYSMTMFYMTLYMIMTAIVYAMWRKYWSLAHFLLLLLFLWEFTGIFVLSFSNGAPYYYYHIGLTAALLFVSHKEFFLKLTFVFMYFMSVTTKFDSTWVLGTYFTALRDGLPLFPDALIPVFTNLVIGMQMIGCWFLISKRWVLQRIAFAYFLFFHFYSGLFVLYFYPSVSVPSLVVLFGPLYRHTPIPFDRKTIAGWVHILCIALFQLAGSITPGDRRFTLEGNKFGMFMFEANHQCIVTVGTVTPERDLRPDIEVAEGTRCPDFFCMVKSATRRVAGGLFLREERYESGTAWNRCYPYEWWTRQNARCDNNPAIQRISVQIDHSINGGPFFRIVDVPNICDLPYHAFRDNTWIKEPPEAPLIGFPVTNTYN